MSRIKIIAKNLRTLLGQDLQERLLQQQERLQTQADSLNQRADHYEAAVDTRIEERLTHFDTRTDDRLTSFDLRLNDHTAATDSRLNDYSTAVDARLEARLAALELRLSDYESALDARVEERFKAIEQRVDERQNEYQSALDTRVEERFNDLDERQAAFQTTLDARVEDRFLNIETRIDERQAAYQTNLDQRVEERFAVNEKRLDDQFSKGAQMLDARFDSRAAANDARLDERLASLDRYVDQRFNTLEKRTDDRLEAHERLVDGKLHSNRQDIVDRTDLLLQVFEQRLDKQRRELAALQTTASAATDDSADNAVDNSETVSSSLSASYTRDATATQTAPDEQSPQPQLVSFRKLAASTDASLRPRLQSSNTKALYERIIEWKKVAHEGLNEFTPDEQETVDYLLSFITDQKELDYTKQHLRRFVATLQRIPPAQKSSDRLLELGSLMHLAPAIKKFCGYREICCSDFWDSEEKIVTETLQQKNGADSFTFELRNFNVEYDVFPYPDRHFRVVLCCELIEHLQRDPMHMLWECNRVLAPDGFLLLTTPNIASARAIEGLLVGCSPYLLSQYNLKTPVDQHNREYAPYEIGVALAAAGFTVVELEAEDVWLRSNPAILELLKQVDITTERRGDNIFALARKTSAPVARYPVELYIE